MSFFEIFQPGLRHLNDERARRTMLTSRPTHGGGAPLGIDLDAGIAKITVRRPAPTAEPTSQPTDNAPETSPDRDAEADEDEDASPTS
jgi:hypothetical protein